MIRRAKVLDIVVLSVTLVLVASLLNRVGIPGLTGNVARAQELKAVIAFQAGGTNQHVDHSVSKQDHLVFEASIAYLYGRYTTAVELSRKALSAMPEHPIALLRLSESFLKLGDPAQAVEVAQGRIPGQYFAAQGLKLCDSSDAQTAEIEGYFDIAQTLGGVRSYWMQFVAECYLMRLKQPQKAEAIGRSLLDSGFGSSFLYIQLARAIQGSGGDPEEALRYHMRSLEGRPSVNAYSGVLGYWRQRDAFEMHSVLEDANKKGFADHPVILIHWAHYYYLIGDVQSAKNALDNAAANVDLAPWTAGWIQRVRDEYNLN